MQVREIMTEKPACCAPDTPIRDAARLMVENDCGEVPVTDEGGKLVGVVTDRDITCRAVAQGKSLDTPVSEIMSTPVVTVNPDTSVEDCCATLEENQIRRAPVVDESGSCCGIVAQADIARNAPEDETARVVRDVSQPSREPSRAGCC